MEPEPPPAGPLLLAASAVLIATYSWPALVAGIVLLILLLISSALVSGSEVAYFSLGPSEINAFAEDNLSSSARIIKLKTKPRILLATILIANNLINIAIIILSDFILGQAFDPQLFVSWGQQLHDLGLNAFTGAQIGSSIEFLITVVFATFLLVLFGEVSPKIYANVNRVAMARFMSKPLMVMRTAFGPLTNVMVKWSSNLENRLGGDGVSNRNLKDDLGKAIELTVSLEKNSEKEIDILKSIVKFGDVTCKQIMRSRVDVVALDIEEKFDVVLQLIKDSGYSRIPVFEEDFDKIKGILYAKDLLIYLNREADFQWQDLIRTEVKFVPEAKRINELLEEFQQERTHMAIVVDEFGGSAGLVTLEDVMEEVIGDIRDEFDDEIEVEYEQLDAHNFIFEGKTLLNDMCRVIGTDTDTFDGVKGEADSMAGMILEMLGKIPQRNSEVRYMDFRFKIIKVTAKRIEKIQITVAG